MDQNGKFIPWNAKKKDVDDKPTFIPNIKSSSVPKRVVIFNNNFIHTKIKRK